MRSLLSQYRELVLVLALLAMPFGLYVAHARDGRELNSADKALLWISAPVQKAIVGVAFSVIDAWQGYVDLRRVREENLAMRRERIALKFRVLALEGAARENERLRKLTDYASAPPNGLNPEDLIAAPVIAVAAETHEQVLRIGKGRRDGIEKDAAVVTPDGAVGVVLSVVDGSADVLLMVDARSTVPAMSQRTQARSTVRGIGAYARCRLDFTLRTDDLEEGDVLLTAGTTGLFPKGIVVGRVTGIRKEAGALFQKAEVIPAVDFTKLEDVLVVRKSATSPDVPMAARGASGR